MPWWAVCDSDSRQS